jgi:hypothetical protein
MMITLLLDFWRLWIGPISQFSATAAAAAAASGAGSSPRGPVPFIY